MKRKVSKAMVGEFLAETKGETNWCVVSFNKETKRRELAYGGFNFFDAFCVMTEQLHKGLDIILTNKDGWKAISEIETNVHRRCTYEELKPYEVVVNEYSHLVSVPGKK